MTPPIVRAGVREIHRVADLVATAFHPLEVAAWLVTDTDERQRALYGHFAIVIEHAMHHGEVLITDSGAGDRAGNRAGALAGAAVWFPLDTPMPPIVDYDRRLWLACGWHTDRFRLLDSTFANHHPVEPHHHLALMAVHPNLQDRGIGSALLEHYHVRLDRAGLPAYLEASSPGSRRLYLRHGYTDYGEPIDLPGAGPRLSPMWRPPQPSQPAPP
jgi:GNAT superfamily N-acetyltransferase